MAKKIEIKRLSQIRSPENTIPKEIEDKIDAWIGNNEESNNPQHQTKETNENQTIDTVRLNINIPRHMHHTLKKMCIDKNTTIKDYLISLINRELNI